MTGYASADDAKMAQIAWLLWCIRWTHSGGPQISRGPTAHGRAVILSNVVSGTIYCDEFYLLGNRRRVPIGYVSPAQAQAGRPRRRQPTLPTDRAGLLAAIVGPRNDIQSPAKKPLLLTLKLMNWSSRPVLS